MKSEYKGSIIEIREIEDCIRATKKYTKGAFSRSSPRPDIPIQGADFPSRLLTEYYEVFPEMEISWNMPASSAIDWLWGDTTHIDVRFQYDYRQDHAKMIILGGPGSLKELSRGIPGFSVALNRITNPSIEKSEQVEEHEQNSPEDTKMSIKISTVAHG
jgi:hypothetical protein